MIEKYRDGFEHFKHVLDCLHIPAIVRAGYKPISPIAKGSDLIHAEIIRKIENAEMVLCDISCLNPNVFFEFGIRTSLNKPITIVKDEFIKKVPFDTGIINYIEYKSSLNPWELETEIKRISDHIKESSENSDGKNSLWKYFGMKTQASIYKGGTDPESKLDYLTIQIATLQRKIENIRYDQKNYNANIQGSDNYSNITLEEISIIEKEKGALHEFLSNSFGNQISVLDIFFSGDRFNVLYRGNLENNELEKIKLYKKKFKYPIGLIKIE